MYIIRRGEVQLSRCDEHGKETVVAELTEGDCFGERALLRNKPYSETALTTTDCEVSVLRLEHVAFAMVKDPSFRRMVEAYLNSEDPDGDLFHQSEPEKNDEHLHSGQSQTKDLDTVGTEQAIAAFCSR